MGVGFTRSYSRVRSLYATRSFSLLPMHGARDACTCPTASQGEEGAESHLQPARARTDGCQRHRRSGRHELRMGLAPYGTGRSDGTVLTAHCTRRLCCVAATPPLSHTVHVTRCDVTLRKYSTTRTPACRPHRLTLTPSSSPGLRSTATGDAGQGSPSSFSAAKRNGTSPATSFATSLATSSGGTRASPPWAKSAQARMSHRAIALNSR